VFAVFALVNAELAYEPADCEYVQAELACAKALLA